MLILSGVDPGQKRVETAEAGLLGAHCSGAKTTEKPFHGRLEPDRAFESPAINLVLNDFLIRPEVAL